MVCSAICGEFSFTPRSLAMLTSESPLAGPFKLYVTSRSRPAIGMSLRCHGCGRSTGGPSSQATIASARIERKLNKRKNNFLYAFIVSASFKAVVFGLVVHYAEHRRTTAVYTLKPDVYGGSCLCLTTLHFLTCKCPKTKNES